MRLGLAAACAVVLAVPAWGSRTTRGGSDYGGGGAPGIPPGDCTGGNTSVFGDVTVICGYSGGFGSSQVTDTLFHFELTNSSPSATVNSATVQFAVDAVPTDFGIVECGDPGDPGSLINSNPMAPCTALNSPIDFTAPTDASGNLILSANRTVVLTFSNFSGLQAGTGLTSGITLFFDVPDSTSSSAAVTAVSTGASSTPEPASLALLALGACGIAGLAALRRRKLGTKGI